MKDRRHNSALQKYLESKDESEEGQMLIEDDTGNEIMEIGKDLRSYMRILEHEDQYLVDDFSQLPSESHRQKLARYFEGCDGL